MATSQNTAAKSSNAGEQAGNVLKEGWNKFHQVGEVIRNDINGLADAATNTNKADSHSIDQQRQNELNRERDLDQDQNSHNTGPGLPSSPRDLNAERLNREVQERRANLDNGDLDESFDVEYLWTWAKRRRLL